MNGEGRILAELKALMVHVTLGGKVKTGETFLFIGYSS